MISRRGHKPASRLHETACQQRRLSDGILAVALLHLVRFLRQVKRVSHGWSQDHLPRLCGVSVHVRVLRGGAARGLALLAFARYRVEHVAGGARRLALGHNARAALITRELAEIARLGAALGGKSETIFGLTGAGDLILTATGDLSRNRRVGLQLAQGLSLQNILGQLGHVAEGVYTAREVAKLARAHGVDMPVTEAVNAVLEGKLAPKAAVEQLLSRDPKQER